MVDPEGVFRNIRSKELWSEWIVLHSGGHDWNKFFSDSKTERKVGSLRDGRRVVRSPSGIFPVDVPSFPHWSPDRLEGWRRGRLESIGGQSGGSVLIYQPMCVPTFWGPLLPVPRLRDSVGIPWETRQLVIVFGGVPSVSSPFRFPYRMGEEGLRQEVYTVTSRSTLHSSTVSCLPHTRLSRLG